MDLEDIWDAIVDAFWYIVSFEWVRDIWEFITKAFEDLSEFSVGGLVFGLISFGTIYLLRDYMLKPFTQYMSLPSAIFWSGATYVSSILVGYIIGKGLFEE